MIVFEVHNNRKTFSASRMLYVLTGVETKQKSLLVKSVRYTNVWAGNNTY